MEWDHVRTLVAVGRTGSLSAAGQSLGIRHSTVGRHLRALEAACRVKIIQLTPRGVKLTEAGQKLFEGAELAEESLRKARELIAAPADRISGEIRIGAPDALGSVVLAPIIAKWAIHHPDLTIQLVATPRLFNMSRREADIAIPLAEPERGAIISKKLADYGLGLYGSKSYLSNYGNVRNAEDLKLHRYIGYIDDLIFAKQLDYLGATVPQARVTFQSSSITAQLNVTRSGAGLCILPHFLSRQFKDLEQVLPEEISLTRSWYLLMHHEQSHLTRFRLVSEMLSDEMARYPFDR